MATVFESIPSAFWAALNNQSLAEMLPPRWSILVNDSGVQCTLFWESSEAAPPSPPPSPEVTNPHQGALPANIRHKRHATQQINDFQNELLFKYQSPELQIPMTPKRVRPNPISAARPAFSSAFTLPSALASRAPLAIPINPSALSMESMKKFEVGDISIDPILANRNALNNLQEAIQTQLQNRGNIIRLNPSSKPSTPGTEPTPPTMPKSVIHLSSDLSHKENIQNKKQSENTVHIKNSSPTPQENCQRRDSVVAENILAIAPAPVSSNNNPNCPAVSVAAESESANCHASLPAVCSAIVVAPSSESSSAFQPSHHHINRQISNDIDNVSNEDVDDMNLEDIVKHQEKMEQSIPSSVSTGNGVISSHISVIDGGLSSSETGRNELLQQREPIMPKQEDIDSDCEVIGDDTNGTPKNLQIRSIVRPPLSFETPLQRPMNQLSIPSFALPSDNSSRNGQPSSQKLVGARSGPLSFNKCSVASVDKLAEQNGHKAELQALRQEANRGDEYLSMSRFVRTLSKIIFEPGELMVDSVKDIDKNKISILLVETQRWYRANMAEVRQTLSIRLSEIRKSKRAAHWQTGRAQVMAPSAWPNFSQNGSMPRYMSDSRYFAGLPLGRGTLALEAPEFGQIREMDS